MHYKSQLITHSYQEWTRREKKNPVPQNIYARKQITPTPHLKWSNWFLMPYQPGRSYEGKHTVVKEGGWVTQLPSCSHINWCLCHNDTRKNFTAKQPVHLSEPSVVTYHLMFEEDRICFLHPISHFVNIRVKQTMKTSYQILQQKFLFTVHKTCHTHTT